MKKISRIPSALQLVAVLFLVHGILSAIGMAVRLTSGSIHIDFGILGIPTFFGLRRCSVGWRTFALVCIWIALVSCPVLFLVGILAEAPTSVQMFGVNLAQVSPSWLSIVSIPVFILALWEYRVLTRPQIRALFFGDSHEPRSFINFPPFLAPYASESSCFLDCSAIRRPQDQKTNLHQK